MDWARLMFADADALSAWRHDDPIDGLADLAFWGGAVDEAAAVFDAPPLGAAGEEGVRGWRDLPIEEAVSTGMAIEAWAAEAPERRLRVDFRPHAHHGQVMAGVRASDAEAGVVRVGGAEMLMAMTTWGDGMFPVVVDFDRDGGVVAMRVEFQKGDEA